MALLARAWQLAPGVAQAEADAPGAITLLTFNCLAQSLARDFPLAPPGRQSNRLGYAPAGALVWTRRCLLLGAEIRRAAPAVACLQEVDAGDVGSVLRAAEMDGPNYDHVYRKKNDATETGAETARSSCGTSGASGASASRRFRLSTSKAPR